MFPPLTSSNLTFSQVALLFHKNPLPLLLHMSSSQVRTFNNKNTLIFLSLLLLFPKISHPHNLLPGGRPSVWPPHSPPLPRLAVHVVGRRHTLRCCRPSHHHCPHAQVSRTSFHFVMSTCLLLFILELNWVTSIMILYRRHIPSMSALPPLLLRLEEQCAKHYYSLPWMCWAEARRLHILLWQTLLLA